MEKNRVAILVLNWNGRVDTERCLRSLEKIQYPHYKIIIIDNGSTDGSQSYFRSHFPDCHLIETHQNLGYAGGNNVGITYALKENFDYILLLNNDTIVDPHLIHPFLKTFSEHPSAGILGTKIYLMDQPNRFDHFGGMWNSYKMAFDYYGYHAEEDSLSFEEPKSLDYVCGAAMMVRSSLFKQIGLLDARYFLYWEEADFCFRARKAGFDVLTCPQAKIWHKVSGSFSGGKPHQSYFYWRNRLLFIEKNCTGLSRLLGFTKLLFAYLPAAYKLKLLAKLQLRIKKILRKDTSKYPPLIRRYDACIKGTHDYLFRKFGSGSSNRFI